MIKLKVCIGSSCHLKGSRQVVEKLQELIQKNNMADKIDFSGHFCMNNCQNGVCVTLDDVIYSLTPEDTETFFNTEIAGKA